MVGDAIEEACASYQFALSTRTGTEAVGHLLRAATAFDDETCIFHIDVFGVFDPVCQVAILRKFEFLTRIAQFIVCAAFLSCAVFISIRLD